MRFCPVQITRDAGTSASIVNYHQNETPIARIRHCTSALYENCTGRHALLVIWPLEHLKVCVSSVSCPDTLPNCKLEPGAVFNKVFGGGSYPIRGVEVCYERWHYPVIKRLNNEWLSIRKDVSRGVNIDLQFSFSRDDTMLLTLLCQNIGTTNIYTIYLYSSVTFPFYTNCSQRFIVHAYVFHQSRV